MNNVIENVFSVKL